MTSPPCSPSAKYHVSTTKRLDITNTRFDFPPSRLATQIEKTEEKPTQGQSESQRDRSDTDPSVFIEATRRNSAPRGHSIGSDPRSPPGPGRRGVKGDPTRRCREMHRNSLPGGTRISLPAAMKLTMMERMSRKRVMSDGDYASDYWCIQVGRGGPLFY